MAMLGPVGLSLAACFPDIPPLEQPLFQDAAVEQGAPGTEAAVEATADAPVEHPEGSDGPPCEPNHADCNGEVADGCETDTLVNPSHCGACFHDCLGGTCYEGACLPVLISDESPYPHALALSNSDGTGDIFWTCEDKNQWVWTASSALSDVKMLAGAPPDSGFVEAGAIGLGSLYVFFVELHASGIWAVAKSGGSLRRVASDSPNGAWDIAVNSTHVFWTNRSEGALRRIVVTAENGIPETIVSEQTKPMPLTLAPDAVFWGDGEDKRILRAGLDGTDPCVIADTLYPPEDIVWDEGIVYWREGDRHDTTQGRVAKAQDVCNSPVDVLADNQGAPRFLAVDDEFVYFNLLEVGTMRRVPKTGGAVEDFYTSLDDIHAIAVDKRAVYWTSWSTGKVFRIAK